MIGKCDSPKSENGLHYEIVEIKIVDGLPKKVGTCKFCGLSRKYGVVSWEESPHQFNMSKLPLRRRAK